MSTRSQTEFRTIYHFKDGSSQTERRTIYRHSDGYPSSMVPDMLAFIKWNGGRTSDVEYTAANWIYWNKKQMEEYSLKDTKGKPIAWDSEDASWLTAGFGVCENDEFHGDIQYYYRVTWDSKKPDEVVIEAFHVEDVDTETKPCKAAFATVNLREGEVVAVEGLDEEYHELDEYTVEETVTA